MKMSLKVIICLMTASVSFLSVAGNQGEQVNAGCVDPPMNQMAYVGDSVTINCSYPREDKSKVKSFCREDNNLECKNVISTQSSNYTQWHRFSMTYHKDRGLYMVVISMLTQDDAGRYQCTLKSVKNPAVCFTKIQLHVFRQDDIIPKNLTCITGETAILGCPYPDSLQNYIKYLCKGDNPSNCVELIRTTEVERDVAVGRFSIRDNKRTKYFYVYIMHLDTTDSGTYWCGFDSGKGKWHHGPFTKIHPCVDKRNGKTKKSSFSTHPTAATSSSTNLDGVIGSVAACLVTIMTVVIVLILCRHKLTRTQGGSPERSINDGQNTQANREGHDYEEIQECTQLKDQLHYASVNFQTDSATGSTDRSPLPGTAENGSSACDYYTLQWSVQ